MSERYAEICESSDYDDVIASWESFDADTYVLVEITDDIDASYYKWIVNIYFQQNPNKYDVILNPNSDEFSDDEYIIMEDLEYYTSYTLTANSFTREDYTFSSWNTEADGSGTSYKDEAKVRNLTTEDGATVTLYAQWRVIISDYTITITEYTGDTLEAEYTYESGSLILYVIDAETLQLFEVWQISETGDYPFSDYYSSWEESLSPGYKIATSPLFASYYYEYGPNPNTTLYKATSELEFLTSDIYGFSVAYGCGRNLWEWNVRLSRNWRMELLLRHLLHHKLLA